MLVRTLKGHLNCVSSVAWSPDGHRIVSGCYDKKVKVWTLISDYYECAYFNGFKFQFID